MLRRGRFTSIPAVLLALLLVVGACDDEQIASPTAPSETSEAVAADEHPTENRGEHSTWARKSLYETDLRVVGPLHTGVPIRAIATTRGTAEARNTRVTLSLPDVDAAILDEWSRLGRSARRGTTLPPRQATTESLGRGHRIVQSTTFTVAEPGYYRIVATARSLDDEPLFDDGALLHSTAQRDVWVWVTEDGGEITEEFDPSLFGDSLLIRPGTFAAVSGRTEHEAALGVGGLPTDDAMISRSHTTLTTPIVSAVYHNGETDDLDPVIGAEVRLYYSYFNHSGQYVTQTQMTSTGGSGTFALDCSWMDQSFDGWVEVLIEVYARNSRVSVGPFGGTHTTNREPDLRDPCTGGPQLVQEVELTPKPGFVYHRMDELIRESRTVFSRSRPRIEVLLDVPPDQGARYETDNDRIRLVPDGDDQEITGQTAYFVQAHEYGHALHFVELGGYNPSWQPCPGGRSLAGAYSIGCAYREGFATFHAAAILPSTNFVRDDVARGALYPAVESSPGVDVNDGSANEGAAAAFLFDVIDGTSETWDALALDGGYAAGLVDTCRVRYSWGLVRSANGIDDLAYCMEREVDPQEFPHEYYFAARGDQTRATSVVQTLPAPSGWSQQAVRDVWVHNLHRLEPAGDPPPDVEDDCDPDRPPLDEEVCP